MAKYGLSRYLERMKRRRIRWTAFASVAAILLGGAFVWHRSSTQHLEALQFLAHVVQVEQAAVDPSSLQNLGWSLAILGRDDEVRSIDFFPQFDRPASTLDVGQLDLQGDALPLFAAEIPDIEFPVLPLVASVERHARRFR